MTCLHARPPGQRGGRDLLDSLLLEYERHQNDSLENIFKPHIATLRRELGFEVSSATPRKRNLWNL